MKHIKHITFFVIGLPARKNISRADPARTCNVTFVQTDGTTHASLIFPGGSTTGLLDALSHHLSLKRSVKHSMWFIHPLFLLHFLNIGRKCHCARSCQDDSMILCEPRASKPRRDPYERTLAELRLFHDKPTSTSYARLG